jgi:hypothetical protein
MPRTQSPSTICFNTMRQRSLYRGTTSQIFADSIAPDRKNGFTATGHVSSKIEGMKADATKLV